MEMAVIVRTCIFRLWVGRRDRDARSEELTPPLVQDKWVCVVLVQFISFRLPESRPPTCGSLIHTVPHLLRIC